MEPDTGRSLLRAWRKRSERTLKDCSEAVGVSHSLWSEWEQGTRKPTLEGAIGIEQLTEGGVPVESWGFSASRLLAVAAARTLHASRATAEAVE
jgi:transcriptional regulator with XRE-family HTH domain